MSRKKEIKELIPLYFKNQINEFVEKYELDHAEFIEVLCDDMAKIINNVEEARKRKFDFVEFNRTITDLYYDAMMFYEMDLLMQMGKSND